MSEVLWPLRLIGFLGWYVWQMARSNVQVTVDILLRRDLSSPVIVGYPTRCRNEFETALLSILVSLTPGTLVLATHSTDGEAPWTLYVHDLYADHAHQAHASVADLETRLLSALRPGGFDADQPASGVAERRQTTSSSQKGTSA